MKLILTLDAVEKLHILSVLEHFNGNKPKAAEALGVSVKTIYNKLNRYGDYANIKSPVEIDFEPNPLPVGVK